MRLRRAIEAGLRTPIYARTTRTWPFRSDDRSVPDHRSPAEGASPGVRGFDRKDAAGALCATGKAFARGLVARATGGGARHRGGAGGAGQDAGAADLALALRTRRHALR